MHITFGERGSGKTTKLIKRSNAIGIPILTATKLRAEALYRDAEIYLLLLLLRSI